MQAPHRTARARRRRGAGVLELILVLPTLVIVVVAMVQFGLLMVLDQAVTAAAGSAAREAGKQPDIAVVRQTVERVLAPHGIAVSEAEGSGVVLRLERPAAATETFGDSALAPDPPSSGLGPRQVRVTVCLTPAAARIPNALATLGLDMTQWRLQASAVARTE